MPAANQGPRGVARPRRRVVSSPLAWGEHTGPVARVAARLAATFCPAPSQFGRVAAGSGEAPPPLANQNAGRGCRAGFGQAAGATWEPARAELVRPGRTGPDLSRVTRGHLLFLGGCRGECPATALPWGNDRILGIFRKGRGRAP